MLALSLMLAAVQINGTDVPASFRTQEMTNYLGCLRSEENGSPDRDAPRLVQFTQLMRFCGERREQWARVLRGLIEARHRDWDRERVESAVEFVIAAFELEHMIQWQNQVVYVSHQSPEPQF